MMRYPSVTQIISPWADFSMIKPEVLERATARGTQVHQICSAIALGLWVPSVPEECQGYVDSFKRWFELVEEVIICEKELINTDLGFKGHPDIVVRYKGEKHVRVVDLKTPLANQKIWRVQIAAYNNLVESCERSDIDKSGTLRLSPDGKLPIYNQYRNLLEDFNIFLSAFNCWRFFKGGK